MNLDLSRITPKMYVILRSSQYGRLFDQVDRSQFSPIGIPRTIYMYWDTSFATAPEVCKICAQSWQDLNPDWKIYLLDAESAESILARSDFPADMLEAHYADALRLKILSTKGGVWVDATVLCLRPLSDWLPMLMYASKCFMFQRPASSLIVSNWFLAAHPGSFIMSSLFELIRAYWADGGSSKYYFFFHQLFEYLVETTPAAKSEFDSVPMIPAPPMLQLGGMSRRGRTKSPLEVENVNFIKTTPMQKLYHAKGFDMSLLEPFTEWSRSK